MTEWPFGTLTPLRYRAILCDPPWHFDLYSERGAAKSPRAHYDCMSLELLRALHVGHLAAPDCLLFMWATWPILPDAIDLLKAWGFKFKSGGAWHKRTNTGKSAFGTGYIFRSASEPYLVGTIGAPTIGSASERNIIETVIDAERREHSRKPDEQYAVLERLIPSGPYCELFARSTRPGWDSWGNEVGKFDDAPMTPEEKRAEAAA